MLLTNLTEDCVLKDTIHFEDKRKAQPALFMIGRKKIRPRSLSNLSAWLEEKVLSPILLASRGP